MAGGDCEADDFAQRFRYGQRGSGLGIPEMSPATVPTSEVGSVESSEAKADES